MTTRYCCCCITASPLTRSAGNYPAASSTKTRPALIVRFQLWQQFDVGPARRSSDGVIVSEARSYREALAFGEEIVAVMVDRGGSANQPAVGSVHGKP
jgi:hypothetical protein